MFFVGVDAGREGHREEDHRLGRGTPRRIGLIGRRGRVWGLGAGSWPRSAMRAWTSMGTAQVAQDWARDIGRGE